MQIKKCNNLKKSLDFLGLPREKEGSATIPKYVEVMKMIVYPKMKKYMLV